MFPESFGALEDVCELLNVNSLRYVYVRRKAIGNSLLKWLSRRSVRNDPGKLIDY